MIEEFLCILEVDPLYPSKNADCNGSGDRGSIMSGLTHCIFEAILSDGADAHDIVPVLLAPSVKLSVSLFSFLLIPSKSRGLRRVDLYIDVSTPEYFDLDPGWVQTCLNNVLSPSMDSGVHF